MKKITILVLLFLLTLTLTSCVNEKQEQLAVYSFYGKNENFIISNGTIVLANSEDIFWGGNLQAAQSESISDISSYKATFYTMVDGKQEIIHVDEVQNLSNSYLLEIDFGKKFGKDSSIISVISSKTLLHIFLIFLISLYEDFFKSLIVCIFL